MAKDPAFLFYSSDFLTGTLLMSDEQVGKYIRLLCLQHQKGHLTEKDMLKICSTYDADIFAKFGKDGEGLYYNDRLEHEIQKRVAYSESRRKNRETKKDMKNICKSHDEHMDNENININTTVIKGSKRGTGGEKGTASFDIFTGHSFSEPIKAKLTQWLKYKTERKESYKPTGLTSFLSEIENKLKVYREEDVIALIGECMANNWKGVIWDRIKAEKPKQPSEPEDRYSNNV